MNVYKFIGLVFLLIGMYGMVRTAINFLVLPKYPTAGVLSFDVFGSNPNVEFAQKETDCFYPRAFYDDAGTTRDPNENELTQVIREQDHCVANIDETRANTKVNDISVSAFFLTLGAGVLTAVAQPLARKQKPAS